MKEKIDMYELSKTEMDLTKGGLPPCYCACYYADKGGSSSNDNGFANEAGGLQSPQPGGGWFVTAQY